MLSLLLALSAPAQALELIPKAGVGIPGLLNTHLELRQPRWAVEAGVGVGLLPPAYELCGRWRPERTCWGCGGPNELALSFGLQGLVLPLNAGAAFILAPEVDAAYTHRFQGPVGVYLGTRLGMGITTEINGDGDWAHLEPGGNIVLLQGGLSFAL
ncbi:MAG: hypothetical protein H6741_00310 [Alphaproteobacteria bacterium]|nr:hypothetical protein [Alphaproteobacteria bacterium]